MGEYTMGMDTMGTYTMVTDAMCICTMGKV